MTAIFRRKTILFDYYTMARDEVGTRRVDPYQLLYQGGQFYLVGAFARAGARSACSASRGSGARSATPPRRRARLPAPGRIWTRAPTPTGSTGSIRRAEVGTAGGPGSQDESHGRSSATSGATARCGLVEDAGEAGDVIFSTPVRERPPADRVGPGNRGERPAAGTAEARRRAPRAAGAADRASHRGTRRSPRGAQATPWGPGVRRPRPPTRLTSRERVRQRPPSRRPRSDRSGSRGW